MYGGQYRSCAISDFHVLSVLHIHRNKAKMTRGGLVLHFHSLSIHSQLQFHISEHFIHFYPFNDENKQQQNTMMCARMVLCMILVFVLVNISAPKVYFSEIMTD